MEAKVVVTLVTGEQLTKDKYLELRESGMSDMEIGRLFGLTRGAVFYYKNKWGLVEKRKKESYGSLCWHCHKARPSLCEWIATGERVFDSYTTEKLKIGSARSQEYVDVVIVKTCKHFEPMKKAGRRKNARKN